MMKRLILCAVLTGCALTGHAQATDYSQIGIPYNPDSRFGDYISHYNVNQEFDEEGKNSDFGLDLSLEAAKKFGTRFSVSLGVNIRTQNNSRDMQRRMLSLGLGYKLINTKKFDLKAGFDFDYYGMKKLTETEYFEKFEDHYSTDDVTGELNLDALGNPIHNGYNYRKGYKETDSYWRGRERYSLSLSASYKPNKRWTFTLKETLQYSHYNTTDSLNRLRVTTDRHKWRYNGTLDDFWIKDEDEGDMTKVYYDKFCQTSSSEGVVSETTPERELPFTDVDNKAPRAAKDRLMLRSKLTVEYDIYGLPLVPYASIDYGCGLNYTASKWKYTLGMDWKVTKQHRISVFYRFQHENDDDEPNGHYLGLGYKITL